MSMENNLLKSCLNTPLLFFDDNFENILTKIQVSVCRGGYDGYLRGAIVLITQNFDPA